MFPNVPPLMKPSMKLHMKTNVRQNMNSPVPQHMKMNVTQCKSYSITVTLLVVHKYIMYCFSYENVPSQECQTAYEHECATVYSTSYETVYKDKCSTKYESECKPSYGYYGGQDCQQVPKQSCIKVKCCLWQIYLSKCVWNCFQVPEQVPSPSHESPQDQMDHRSPETSSWRTYKDSEFVL